MGGLYDNCGCYEGLRKMHANDCADVDKERKDHNVRYKKTKYDEEQLWRYVFQSSKMPTG